MIQHKLALFRIAVVLVLIALISACTSSLVLGQVYNRFGNRMANHFLSFATFNDEQIMLIRDFSSSYHSWHRSAELPRYAALLRQIVSDINSSEPLEFAAAESWWIAARDSSDEMRRCNPFNVSARLLASLSDEQVKQMAGRMRAEHNREEKEYFAETPEQRLESRIKFVSKWGGRIGLSFNPQQLELLRETFNQQISLGKQRYQVRRVWLEEYIGLLNARSSDNFEPGVHAHIASLWRLTADTFPQKWQANERLWTEFMQRYINLQTPEQRQKFSNKALRTAVAIDTIAVRNTNHAPVCHSQ